MYLLPILIILSLFSCKAKSVTQSTEDGNNKELRAYFVNMYGDTIPRITKTNEEWKSLLTPAEYNVLREKGTERAFTGMYDSHKVEGLYTCKGCNQVLFASKHKFDSGTGWPSFYEVLDSNTFIMETDHDLGYPRTEVMCGRCGGHLGHVFPDGPPPTGLRYCINSVSLGFVRTEYKK